MARTDLWTREQMILVLNLYMKLPFGKMDARNPDVKHLASIIGRTAGAVAYRLTNYASCDPILKARGISGMQNGRMSMLINVRNGIAMMPSMATMPFLCQRLLALSL